MKLSETLTWALQQLRSRGYTEDFSLQLDYMYCAACDLPLGPEQFQVDAVFRFEGHSDSGDQFILYAIRAIGLNLRGVLLNAYGVYADPLTAAMEARLRQPLR